jgi:hypothetical protein
MTAKIFNLFGRSNPQQDWSQQEIAEFYRVEGALLRAGVRVTTERGLSDEGDPWFVFVRADDGEVVIHLARIDGEYILASSAYRDTARGPDFTALVKNLIANHPLVQRSETKNSNVFLHPAALLIAIVGTAFFKTGEARADDGKGDKQKSGAGGGHSTDAVRGPATLVHVEAKQAVAILAGVLLAIEYSADNPAAVADQVTRFLSLPMTSNPERADPSELTLRFDRIGAAASDTAIGIIDHLPAPQELLGPVLSLVAVLTSLSRSPSIETSPHETTLAGPVGGVVDAGSNSRTSAPDAYVPRGDGAARADFSSLIIEIALSPDALPNVEAVRLIQQVLPEFGGPMHVSVVRVDHLPAIIAQMIAAGTQVREPGFVPPVSGDAGQVGGAIRYDEAGHLVISFPGSGPDAGNDDGYLSWQGDNGSGGLGSIPAADTSVAPPASEQGVTPPSTPAPPLPTLTGGSGPSVIQTSSTISDAKVGAYLSYFIAHSSDIEVMVSGHSIVVVDEIVLKASYTANVDSVTFHLGDGSTISLIGQSAVIYDTIATFG